MTTTAGTIAMIVGSTRGLAVRERASEPNLWRVHEDPPDDGQEPISSIEAAIRPGANAMLDELAR